VETTTITKNGSNNFSKAEASGFPKKLFSTFNKKPKLGLEFTKENIKQNHMNYTNFGNLICLQSFDDEKRPSLDINSKKEKNTNSIWVAKFCPNNKLLATGGSDEVLRVYKVTIMNSGIQIKENGDPSFQVIDQQCTLFIGHKCDIVDIAWFKVSFWEILSINVKDSKLI